MEMELINLWILISAILTTVRTQRLGNYERNIVILIPHKENNILQNVPVLPVKEVLTSSTEDNQGINLLHILRTPPEPVHDYEKEKEERIKKQLVTEQHERRIRELTEYMKTHMLSTAYFYDEMKRILKNRVVKNNLRKMVEYLERPENQKVRQKVLDCFMKYRKIQPEHNYFDLPTNNLVINIVRDPNSDGFVN